MNKEDIKKLRPSFKFGEIVMIDWFEVLEGKGYCVIRSGLRHADGITKSLYDYEYFKGGNDATNEVLNHFNNWWRLLNKNKDE
jgi:hypothetical protein